MLRCKLLLWVNSALMAILRATRGLVRLIQNIPAGIDRLYYNAGRRAARANLDLIKTQPGR